MADHRHAFHDLASHHHTRALLVETIEKTARAAREAAYRLSTHIKCHAEDATDDESAEELFRSIEPISDSLASRLGDLRSAIDNFLNTISTDP